MKKNVSFDFIYVLLKQVSLLLIQTYSTSLESRGTTRVPQDRKKVFCTVYVSTRCVSKSRDLPNL